MRGSFPALTGTPAAFHLCAGPSLPSRTLQELRAALCANQQLAESLTEAEQKAASLELALADAHRGGAQRAAAARKREAELLVQVLWSGEVGWLVGWKLGGFGGSQARGGASEAGAWMGSLVLCKDDAEAVKPVFGWVFLSACNRRLD
eukprot:359618-Chlamydomonas_euryale.AAC.4